MQHDPGDRIFRRCMTRRDFLWLMSVAGSGLLHGCATDPVTGKTVLVGMSEAQEVELDRSNSPHQFSADYGAVQQPAVNDYLSDVGQGLAANSHRPQMPYSFRAVNANHVNAYAFPGGSIGVTRGILVELDNEAELAALLGHEVGHVTARHAAEQAGKTMLAQAALMGGAVYAGSRDAGLGELVTTLGSLGAGALLAHYSRDNERESDRLGLDYMTRSGYNPEGMVGLMDVLRSQQRSDPNALELMFATHPPSEERYRFARQEVATRYAADAGRSLQRERYLDNTFALRRLKPAIEKQREGEAQLAKKRYRQAEAAFRGALTLAPDDYAGNMLLGKSLLAQERTAEAQRAFEKAKAIYPAEAQSHHFDGISKLQRGNYAAAFRAFDDYEKRLPGNPNTVFLKGIALESMQDRSGAAAEYYRYLRSVNQGQAARHAYQRLQAWGYLQQR